MIEFLSCVGFAWNEKDKDSFFDAYIRMLEYYEERSSENITAHGQNYLVLRADPLEILFPVNDRGDANADAPELFYKTDRWQPITEVQWCPKQKNNYIQIANAFSADGISLNVCVPGAYADGFDGCQRYELQVACFAMKCSVCSEEAYLKSGSSMAPMAFINTGSLQQDASCIANGKITDITVCKNPYSGCEYYHFTARCEDVVLDILANKNIVSDAPQIGHIITVHGWLTGKFRTQ